MVCDCFPWHFLLRRELSLLIPGLFAETTQDFLFDLTFFFQHLFGIIFFSFAFSSHYLLLIFSCFVFVYNLRYIYVFPIRSGNNETFERIKTMFFSISFNFLSFSFYQLSLSLSVYLPLSRTPLLTQVDIHVYMHMHVCTYMVIYLCLSISITIYQSVYVCV